MKPTFALNFTDTSISLLHRTAKGWVQVGETPFDAPDLDEALDYLRNTALGMSPGGFSTKLVIPNGQLLYAEIEAPGPSDDERRAQITAALEERTSLKADEMVFDWSGKGKTVKVVAVDRNTLTEAEDFATRHRFEPASFVAIPEPGTFSGEPWFGPAGAAAALPADRLTQLRDKTAISIVDGPKGPRPAAKAEAPAEAADAAPETTPDTAAESPAARVEAPLARPAAPETPEAEGAADEIAPQPLPEPVTAEVEVETPPVTPADEARGLPAEAEVTIPQDLLSSLQAAPEGKPEAAGQADSPEADRASDSPAFRAPGAEDTLPPTEPAAGLTAVAPPASPAADEAPFTHVADSTAFPEAADDIPPMPAGLAARGEARTSVLDPVDDDLPPAPSPAAMTAFASRRGVEAESLPRTPPPISAPTRPDAATLARAARGKPVEELPPMPRPPQAGARPALQGAKSSALRGPGGLVTAPSIPGTRKAKAKPQPATAAPPAAAAASPADAARSLGRSPFARPPQRGKPRYLGLILTAILLICLALVAAWSSFYLTARNNEPAAVDVATSPATPAVEDEMLADGVDPGALAEPQPDAAAPDAPVETVAVPAPAETAPKPEPAPETAAAKDDGPVASALLDQQDEIFLAGNEAPPPAFDALSLPAVDRTADTLPAPPMPPPPYGTVYRFDTNGQVVPTPEGILSPEGVLLFAGKPPRVPPVRSALAEAAAVAARAAPAVPPVAGATETAAPAEPAAQPNPELFEFKPRPRPEGLAPAKTDGAALETDTATAVTSLRPRARPPTVLAAGEQARAETAAASLAAPTEAAATLASADAANPSLLAISRRPAAKPKDFSGAVEAAVAAAVRMPEPEPAPEPAPKAAAKEPEAAPDLKPEEQDEIDQPEVAATAAPKIPTKASVAKQATYVNALNLSKVNLIGVYGTQSKRYALVRLANGKYKKVKVGDRLEGGTVQAITQSEVRYQKGGRLVALKMPKG